MQKITSISASLSNIAFDGPDLVLQLKKIIRAHQAELFDRFDQGTPVLELLAARSDFIDRLLRLCWKNLMGSLASRLSLLAVGGYGRRELHPYSDIDILVLLDSDDREIYETPIINLFTLLWDIGLKPGQSVRTVAECREAARWDQTIMTTLIEARLIIGSDSLFRVLRSRTGPDQIWPSHKFFLAKIEEQQQRYAKHNNTGYNLEPNIKEGPGGLRDIQLSAWVIKRHFDSATLYELVARGCLTQAEYSELMTSQKFLWKVRFGLQKLAGRSEDRLLFDYQKPLAELFGYRDCDQSQAVEKFMQHYYRTVMGLERLNELLLQYFREVMLGEEQKKQQVVINERFRSLNGMLDVIHPNIFNENPWALLELFLLLQQHEFLTGVRAATIRLIRHSLYLIDDNFRRDPACTRLFIEIMEQKSGVARELRRMNRYGVLAAYYPAFAHIVGRMQYDLFHVYTVDEHSLLMVNNLREFAPDRQASDLPFCNSVFLLIPSPALLYIAGLLHDICKGKGGDHSTMGEQVARQFCEQHRLSLHDTQLVSWLVRRHLLMSVTSQRQDITDPEVVHKFAAEVQTEERLNYLYLLTVADIRATNPRLWNSWKDSLLRDLYVATYRALNRGLQNTVDHDEILTLSQDEARSALTAQGIETEAIGEVWGYLPEEYFMRHTTDEIVWHTMAIINSSPQEQPLVLLRPQSARGTVEIFLYAPEQESIFSDTSAVLDQLGLNILEARLITGTNGFILNSYQVLEQSGDPIRDLYREQQIAARLRESIINPGASATATPRKMSRSSRIFQTATQVHFHPESHRNQTVMDIYTTDRFGLLSLVARIFQKFGIRVHTARIITIGNRAEDTFYITDRQNRPLTEEALQSQLREALTRELDSLE